MPGQGGQAGSDELRITVLGHVELGCPGGAVGLTPSERILVAGLALARGRVVSIDSLTDWMWGETEHASPRNRIQALVSSMRRKVPCPLVTTHALGYSLDHRVDSDLAHRDRLLAVLPERDATLGERRALLREAVQLTTGEPLAGCRETEAVLAARHRLSEDALELLVERVESDLQSRRYDGLVAELVAITAEHPLREAFQAQLVRALAQTGRRAEALDRYRQVYTLLDRELGVRPGPTLSAAQQEVLRMEEPVEGPVTSTPSAPARPETDSAPLRRGTDESARPPRPVPRTAPRAVHRLVGRRAEREAIRAAAQEAATADETAPASVVAITGAGGVGKSALAIDAAHRLRDQFPDGTLYLSMTSATGLRGGTSVLGLFLGMLGVSAAAVPDEHDARVALYRSVLDDLRVLIVLEDVTDPPDVADLLPPTASSMAILTSRGTLAACDPTLVLPLAELSREESIHLLTRIVGERDPDPSGLAELAAQCLDLPLLLCVAGRRVAAHADLSIARTTSELASERAQKPGHDTGHEAVVAGLDVAEAQLRPRSRTVLAWLAGLPLERMSRWLVEALADDARDATSTFDELCDAGLLERVVGDGCSAQVRLHDLVRGHAREPRGRVTAPESQALVRAAGVLAEHAARHGRHYPARLLPLPPGLVPDDGHDAVPGDALTFFRTEYDTMLTLARGTVDDDPGLAWRLLVLAGNHVVRAPQPERWVEVAEVVWSRLDTDTSDDRRGRAHIDLTTALVLHETSSSRRAATLAQGALRHFLGDDDIGAAIAAAVVVARAERANGNRDRAEEALQWASTQVADGSDPVVRGYLALARGSLLDDYDDLVGAREYLREAIALLEGTPDWWALGTSECALARVTRRLGRYEEGLAAVERAERISSLLDDVQGRVTAVDARADLLVHMRRFHEALPVAREALAEAHRHRDVFVLHRSQRTLGRALAGLGRTEEAQALFLESAAGFQRTERPLSWAATLRDLGVLLLDEGRTAEALGVVEEERSLLVRSGVDVDADLVERRRRLLGALGR